MAHKSNSVHKKYDIIKKLLEDLSEFMSDQQIAAIATRVLHTKVNYTDVEHIRRKEGIRIEKSSGRPYRGRSCTDLYDHRNIREFLDKSKECDKLQDKNRKR